MQAQHIRERFLDLGFGEYAKLSGKDLCVLDFLCRRLQANPAGIKCYPSFKEISQEIPYSPKSVERSVRGLAQKNIISIERKANGCRYIFRLSETMIAVWVYIEQNKITKRRQIDVGKFFTDDILTSRSRQFDVGVTSKRENHSLYNNQNNNQNNNQGASRSDATHVDESKATAQKSLRSNGRGKRSSSDEDPNPASHKIATTILDKYKQYTIDCATDKFLNGSGVINGGRGGILTGEVCERGEIGSNNNHTRDYFDNHGTNYSPNHILSSINPDFNEKLFHAAQIEKEGRVRFKQPCPLPKDGEKSAMDDVFNSYYAKMEEMLAEGWHE